MLSTHVRTIAPSNLCVSGIPTSNSIGEPPRTPSSALRRARKSLRRCLCRQSATTTLHVAYAPKAKTTASSHWDAKGGPSRTSARHISGIMLGTTLGETSTRDSLTPCRKRPQLLSFLRPTASPFVPAQAPDTKPAQTQSAAASAAPLTRDKPLLFGPPLRPRVTSNEGGATSHNKHHYLKEHIEKCKRQNLRTGTRA